MGGHVTAKDYYERRRSEGGWLSNGVTWNCFWSLDRLKKFAVDLVAENHNNPTSAKKRESANMEMFLDAISAVPEFVVAVLSSLAAYLMGGVIMAVVWAWEHKYGKPTPSKVCKWGIVAFLFISFFSAWLYQRNAFRDADKTVNSLNAQLGKEQEKVAIRDSQITILQNQVQSQQKSINEALVQLGKAQQQEPLKLTQHFLRRVEGFYSPGIAANVGNYLVLTNKTITPIRLLVSCDKEIAKASGTILGGGVQTGGRWGGRVTNKNNEYGIGILLPAWTPINPLLVTVYTDKKTLDCVVSLR